MRSKAAECIKGCLQSTFRTAETRDLGHRFAGAPDRIRTCDLCLRRAALYPAELRVRSLRGLADGLRGCQCDLCAGKTGRFVVACARARISISASLSRYFSPSWMRLRSTLAMCARLLISHVQWGIFRLQKIRWSRSPGRGRRSMRRRRPSAPSPISIVHAWQPSWSADSWLGRQWWLRHLARLCRTLPRSWARGLPPC